MKLRAKVYRDPMTELWLVTFWTLDEGPSRFFGHTSMGVWEDALSFALWRVGLSGRRIYV